jgi:hypothetical protein
MTRLHGTVAANLHAYHKLDTEDIAAISTLRYTNHIGGVVHFHNVFEVDQSSILPYIDAMAYVPSCGLEIVKDENGNMLHGQTLDGQIISIDKLLSLPMRVGGGGMPEPVNPTTPSEIWQFFESIEEWLYRSLIRYCDLYPLIVNTIWWRMRGHCLKYLPDASLGLHNDNDTNTFTIDGQRYYSQREIGIYQVVNALAYFNDEYEGGEMHFPYLNLTIKPKTGDIIFFPANYVGTHGVSKVLKGSRYSYLTQFGHGGEHRYEVAEAHLSESWLAPVFIPFLYQDHVAFSHSGFSDFNNERDVELGFHGSTIEGQQRSFEGPATGTKLPYND